MSTDCSGAQEGGGRLSPQSSGHTCGYSEVKRTRDTLLVVAELQPAPNASALVEALKQILGWRELRSGREFPIERIEDIARAALAAYRKGARNEDDQ